MFAEPGAAGTACAADDSPANAWTLFCCVRSSVQGTYTSPASSGCAAVTDGTAANAKMASNVAANAWRVLMGSSRSSVTSGRRTPDSLPRATPARVLPLWVSDGGGRARQYPDQRAGEGLQLPERQPLVHRM